MKLIDKVPKHWDDFAQEYYIILWEDRGVVADVAVSVFEDKFEGAETFEEYYNHENATQSYKDAFIEWNEKGYFD